MNGASFPIVYREYIQVLEESGMKGLKILRSAALGLAALGVVVPNQVFAANEAETSRVSQVIDRGPR